MTRQTNGLDERLYMVDVGVHVMVSNNANSHEERYPVALQTNWQSIDVDCGRFYASIAVRISANRLDLALPH